MRVVKEPSLRLPHKRESTGELLLLPSLPSSSGHLHHLPPLVSTRAPPSPSASVSFSTPSTATSSTTMPPKAGKGKGKGKAAAVAAENKLAKMRRESATFPPLLNEKILKRRYKFAWAVETRDHPATQVRAPTSAAEPGEYPFFADFFWCGLCPPYSEFFIDIMNTYNLQLLDFHPNAVTCLSVFAHLCENFVGVHPSTALFRHYFSPRIQSGDALSGSVTWIPKAGTKDSYLEGTYRERWDEWRGKWCWVREGTSPMCRLH